MSNTEVITEVITEAEAARRYDLSTALESGGDYGLNVLVVHGDIDDVDGAFGDDAWFRALCGTQGDVGTVVVDGNVRVGNASISDRLMCLVVLKDFSASELNIKETEMLVVGTLVVDTLRDVDALLSVQGERRVVVQLGYDDEVVARNDVPVER